MYHLGNPTSHFQGSPSEQARFAREELSDALVGDDDSMIPDGMREENYIEDVVLDNGLSFYDKNGDKEQDDDTTNNGKQSTPEHSNREFDDTERSEPATCMRQQYSSQSSPSMLAGSSRASLDDWTASSAPTSLSVENYGPGFLLATLEDALPKQQDQQQQIGQELTPAELQKRREQLESMWERVRRWLWANGGDIGGTSSNSNDDRNIGTTGAAGGMENNRRAAAHLRGSTDATCLHLICKLPNPPLDVVQAIVEAAPDVVSWTDAHGWLPLHHACANGADPNVIKVLIDAFPSGSIQQDKQLRTPLHFYATRVHAPEIPPAVMARNAELLTCPYESVTAAQLPDRNGMLPMHYACAYGTHPAVLKVMVNAFPDSLTAKEKHGRTPMHLAMVNAHRDASPDTIRFLLTFPSSRATINTRDQDGYLPLHLMTLGLKGYSRAESDQDKRFNVSESLSLYLGAEPTPVADFLTAIQDLPDWLQDTAVVSSHVRNVVNEKIVKRFPTSILLMDGYMLIVVIICFAVTTKNHIDLRFDREHYQDTTRAALVFLFIGAIYFILRELVQIVSLASIGSLNAYWKDFSNWLDFAVFILVLNYACLMASHASVISDDVFRTGVAFTQGLLWVSAILFLKKTLVGFAVFVGGVVYVVRRLVAFLMAVAIMLLCCAQLFYFVYVDTDICQPPTPEVYEYLGGSVSVCTFGHCTFGRSLLKVYTMMMGEINYAMRYATNFSAQIVFLFYAFVVVILLSHVLIAIVVDSYEIIQNDRASIVFWSNRLEFVAEIDAISYTLKRRLMWGSTNKKGERHVAGASTESNPSDSAASEALDVPAFAREGDSFDEQVGLETSKDHFREAWHQIIMLYDVSLYDDIDWWETFIYNIFRIFCALVIIPLWLTLGAVTAGWLWPPQVREYLFAQKEVVLSHAELARKKLEQLQSIQDDLKLAKTEIVRERASNREDMMRIRVEVEMIQGEVLADLQQVKELMTSLLVVER